VRQPGSDSKAIFLRRIRPCADRPEGGYEPPFLEEVRSTKGVMLLRDLVAVCVAVGKYR
jgi:hypothetical protein